MNQDDQTTRPLCWEKARRLAIQGGKPKRESGVTPWIVRRYPLDISALRSGKLAVTLWEIRGNPKAISSGFGRLSHLYLDR